MSEAEGEGKAAQRSCVACRETGERGDLIRIVLGPDGRPWVDYRGRLPGRGAWVHPIRACVEAVERKPGLLSRAFKQEIREAVLLAPLRALVEAAALDGLSQAAAAGAIVFGHDVVEAAVARGEVAQLWVAKDASDRTVGVVQTMAGEKIPVVIGPCDKDTLGRRIGRGPVAIVGSTPAEACAHLRVQLRRLRSLG